MMSENDIAIIEENGPVLSYKELKEHIHDLRENCFQSREFVLVISDHSLATILFYVSCLSGKIPIMIINEHYKKAELEDIITRYRPKLICSNSKFKMNQFKNYRLKKTFFHHMILSRNDNENYIIDKEIALLLSTSSSTGSKKFVMLSYRNIEVNTLSIIRALHIEKGDRAAVMLPLSYTYGLSIVNTYLKCKGTLLIPTSNIFEENYWLFLSKNRVNAICGVPYTYYILMKLNILKNKKLNALKLMTQAGGKLDQSTQQYFLQIAQKDNVNFAIMYGQTEATARISCYFLNEYPEKIGSVGLAIPGGKISLDEMKKWKYQGQSVGEIIYEGENVYMGYADNLESICSHCFDEDQSTNILHTGDFGYIDSDNFLYIKGRISRFIKLYGVRISLDELEDSIKKHLSLDAVCIAIHNSVCTEKLGIIIPNIHKQKYNQINLLNLLSGYGISSKMVQIKAIKDFPHNQNGKIDYLTLEKFFNHE